VLEQRGDRTAVDLLSEVANSQLVDMNLRIQAMGMLASYQSGKRPAYRYIEDVVGMKAPQSLEEARQYLSRLSFLVAEGRLDVDGAAAIKDLLQGFIDSVVGSDMERRLQILEEIAREQAARGFGAAVTVVQGGMPVMPGCEGLIMPAHPGPPVIEQKPNPWATPDAASDVDAAPKRKRGPGRPQKYADQAPEPPPTPDPPDDNP
jgi:hypothetical protein